MLLSLRAALVRPPRVRQLHDLLWSLAMVRLRIPIRWQKESRPYMCMNQTTQLNNQPSDLQSSPMHTNNILISNILSHQNYQVDPGLLSVAKFAKNGQLTPFPVLGCFTSRTEDTHTQLQGAEHMHKHRALKDVTAGTGVKIRGCCVYINAAVYINTCVYCSVIWPACECWSYSFPLLTKARC